MSKRILLISTDPITHEDIKNSIEKSGYRIDSAYMHKNILEDIRTYNPHLILLDVCNKPHETHDLCEQLHTDDDLCQIPLFLICDWAQEYIVKPITPEILEAKIKKYIGKEHVGKKRILIVDDEVDLCKTLRFRLSKWGYDVSMAHEGQSALSMIKQSEPDLIILDLGLPKISGEELCKIIREDDKTDHIPIIMLTAKDSDADRVIGKVIGANYYFTKPFQVLELKNAILDLLKE